MSDPQRNKSPLVFSFMINGADGSATLIMDKQKH